MSEVLLQVWEQFPPSVPRLQAEAPSLANETARLLSVEAAPGEGANGGANPKLLSIRDEDGASVSSSSGAGTGTGTGYCFSQHTELSAGSSAAALTSHSSAKSG